MHARLFVAVLAAAFVCTPSIQADLISEFSGFDAVWEVGVSGFQSSYHADTVAGIPFSGPTTHDFLHDLGPARVSYPYGVGEVPSPGGNLGKNFDQGVLGIKLEGENLVIRLATGLNPLEGFYYSGWDAWYGQGDLFLSVEDTGGIAHYGLLSAWARDEFGNPRSLNGGHFDDAQAFHVGGRCSSGSREGNLIKLTSDNDITLSGGRGSYNAGNAPAGLDLRAFVEGGIDLGDAGLVHDSLSDLGQMWYLQTWAVDLNLLSNDPVFEIGLHAVPSCGNDQVGTVAMVPEPSAAVLAAIGLLSMGCIKRRRAH
jgi:hypothetical protein